MGRNVRVCNGRHMHTMIPKSAMTPKSAMFAKELDCA